MLIMQLSREFRCNNPARFAASITENQLRTWLALLMIESGHIETDKPKQTPDQMLAQARRSYPRASNA